MAKYHGIVAYSIEVETEPGVWETEGVEKEYYGDIIKRRVTVQRQGEINPIMNIQTTIKVIADPFANDHFDSIQYATYLGKKWKITSVDVEYPNMTLFLGGIFNG